MKRDYELAVDEFTRADEAYRRLLGKFEDGSIMEDVMRQDPVTLSLSIVASAAAYVGARKELERLKEERNTKLTEAQGAMRAAVQLAPTQWRGPDGSATILRYGPFTVSSVTKRAFDPGSLMAAARRVGVIDSLLSLRATDRNGKEYGVIEQKWEVDYERVRDFLRDAELEEVITSAYDEKESTPQVKGPKQVALMGEEMK